MRLSHYRPSPRLANFVSMLYVFEADGPAFDDRLSALMAQLQFRITGRLTYDAAAEGARLAPDAPLMGPGNRYMALHCEGPMLLVGAGLLPQGWARLARIAADEVSDRVIDARALWGRDVDATLDQARDARDDAGRIAAIDGFLCRLLCDDSIDGRIVAVEHWIARTPHSRIDALAPMLDLSQRQVARLTAHWFGAPPRLLASKYRTLRASALLATGQARNWMDAADGGFADQAHFIRHFQRFVGQAPGRFSAGEIRLARLVMRSKWQAGARSPIALWS